MNSSGPNAYDLECIAGIYAPTQALWGAEGMYDECALDFVDHEAQFPLPDAPNAQDPCEGLEERLENMRALQRLQTAARDVHASVHGAYGPVRPTYAWTAPAGGDAHADGNGNGNGDGDGDGNEADLSSIAPEEVFTVLDGALAALPDVSGATYMLGIYSDSEGEGVAAKNEHDPWDLTDDEETEPEDDEAAEYLANRRAAKRQKLISEFFA
jgi:hypothetical protein